MRNEIMKWWRERCNDVSSGQSGIDYVSSREARSGNSEAIAAS